MLLLVPEGVVEHYQMINDAIKGDMPLMVYNDPYLARQNIGIPIWQKLLKMENVKGLYDENYQLTHTQQLLPAIADKISVFEHETQFYFDTATFPNSNFSMVTVYGLAAPKAILEYYGACRTGNRQRALKLQKLIVEGYRIVPHRSSKIQPASVPARTNIPAFLMHQAAFLNAIAEIGGNNAGPPRTPYQPLPQKYHSELAQLIQRLNDSI
jgi:dihydrodipicolinate synthase/N-acetylneuraminate lyase